MHIYRLNRTHKQIIASFKNMLITNMHVYTHTHTHTQIDRLAHTNNKLLLISKNTISFKAKHEYNQPVSISNSVCIYLCVHVCDTYLHTNTHTHTENCTAKAQHCSLFCSEDTVKHRKPCAYNI